MACAALSASAHPARFSVETAGQGRNEEEHQPHQFLFGSELAAQLGTLYSAMASGWEQSQAWLAQSGLDSDWLSLPDSASAGQAVPALFSTASTTFNAITDQLLIVFVAIFLGVEPKVYLHGFLVLLPHQHQETGRDALKAAGG